MSLREWKREKTGNKTGKHIYVGRRVHKTQVIHIREGQVITQEEVKTTDMKQKGNLTK